MSNKKCSQCDVSISDNDYYYVLYTKDTEKYKCEVCYDIDSFYKFAESRVISTNLLLKSLLINRDLGTDYMKPHLIRFTHLIKEIASSSDSLRNKCKEFEANVWFAGLQEFLAKATKKGVSAKLNNFSVLTYCIAGRSMITIEDDKGSITFLTEEDSKESRMGLHGMASTSEHAHALVNAAIEYWKSGELIFLEDSNISMI